MAGALLPTSALCQHWRVAVKAPPSGAHVLLSHTWGVNISSVFGSKSVNSVIPDTQSAGDIFSPLSLQGLQAPIPGACDSI